MEHDVLDRLVFLDLLLIKEDNKVEITVYRKPTHSGVFTHLTSFVPYLFKVGLINTLLSRAHSSTRFLSSLTDDRSWCLPTIYILLTHKDSTMYLEAFQALASNCPILAPQVIMMNFEQALRSYKTQYETVTTNPVTSFKEHSLVHTWVRRLMMLAMVPVSDVPDAFANIAEYY
jgi:hypothetical protein